jgi:hypothetical protein
MTAEVIEDRQIEVAIAGVFLAVLEGTAVTAL